MTYHTLAQRRSLAWATIHSIPGIGRYSVLRDRDRIALTMGWSEGLGPRVFGW